MSLSRSRSRFLKGFLFCLPQGLGEAGMFLGSSVFFAIAAAVAAARKERGLPLILAINSPATAEVIRMACEDQFTNLVWDDLHLVCKCLYPFSWFSVQGHRTRVNSNVNSPTPQAGCLLVKNGSCWYEFLSRKLWGFLIFIEGNVESCRGLLLFKSAAIFCHNLPSSPLTQEKGYSVSFPERGRAWYYSHVPPRY